MGRACSTQLIHRSRAGSAPGEYRDSKKGHPLRQSAVRQPDSPLRQLKWPVRTLPATSRIGSSSRRGHPARASAPASCAAYCAVYCTADQERHEKTASGMFDEARSQSTLARAPQGTSHGISGLLGPGPGRHNPKSESTSSGSRSLPVRLNVASLSDSGLVMICHSPSTSPRVLVQQTVACVLSYPSPTHRSSGC